ncbi:MAG TPA: 16S rRNA (uracil(1498)-N(3))-methyltransferase [Candidatus Lachnoclostridium stercorigallinarum]|uniref:Ribosomal RNA small subunit methyltransferase E n=1 Tax=Candidatus Lachnoclostridium stercorigallinarum TaxID=2838634 RepID=A0A9D2GG45_9FIRM|nr:16S rRNA (uracil(1498)-N(3))-methyltransferase [Candidatus Lachnoclostridium stercorigallinarum]
MFRFFVAQDQIDEGTGQVVITGPDVNHIRNVLRMRPGEKIRISNGKDRDYLCAVAETEGDQVTAEILETEESTELPARIWLFQGLPKSDKMELIIQKAVELGVYRIVPVATRRAVVKLDKKKEEAKRKRWNAISESAAKQSKRLIIPEVTEVMAFSQACGLASSFDRNFIPYELAQGMKQTRQELQAVRPGMEMGIFIGPEGGFDEEEIRTAMDAGIRPVTLGKRILRTETAGLYVLSVLGFLLEDQEDGAGETASLQTGRE